MRDTTSFGRHLLKIALLLVPAAYFAQLLATAVHESLGHGLVAVLVGGRFTGFSLAWDGMGSAVTLAPDGATPGERTAVLAGGVASTCALGLILLGAAIRASNGPLRWVLLVASATALLEGGPYAFWNAWEATGNGDIGRILRLHGATPGWRAAFLIAGGLFTVAGTMLPLGRLLLDVEASFPPDIDLAQGRRWMMAGLFGGATTAAWWLFDWDQLVPGAGVLPQVTGMALAAGTSAWFALRPANTVRASGPVVIGTGTIVACWAIALAGLAGTLLWLGRGVRWSG